ncbi:hypothetical protein E8E12_007527 [Didymella heteroderae]|uniref:Uncharacterized protein n=1 Tax=Didymella heteroderae TaxID=1769908 RepID=A0A9P5BZ73_9PLEO|nr:hypothetical protein E8E12_007527 [Didymella heteroderae]
MQQHGRWEEEEEEEEEEKKKKKKKKKKKTIRVWKSIGDTMLVLDNETLRA